MLHQGRLDPHDPPPEPPELSVAPRIGPRPLRVIAAVDLDHQPRRWCREVDDEPPDDQLPPEAELPAAPMVVAAYAFIWVAFLVYVISLVKRIRRVETDLQRLEREPRR